MKRKKLLVIFFTIICTFAMVIPSFASVRASDQIRDYLVDVKSDNGEIYIDFSVTGKGGMDRIGCESIRIYESNNGRLVDSFDENDVGMSRSNTFKYANMITTDCQVGTRYRIEVTIFAADSAGRDTRSQTFYVTGQA